MKLNIEKGSNNQGVQLIRAVVDTIQQCNLRCKYCHPGEVWQETNLSSDVIKDVLIASENFGLFEITLSGGEITLHPELDKILEHTHVLKNTVATFITNATKVTDYLIESIKNSNLSRICVSVDGPDSESHNSARGNTYHKVIKGLYELNKTGKDITVISVAHHRNYDRLLDLSWILANEGLATQHHLCSPSYSGEAKKYYEEVKLRDFEYDELQQKLDENFIALRQKNLYVTFNSYFPATGRRSHIDVSRQITLVQLTEQLKDCYLIVRSNGDIRLTSAAWGRETIGNAVVGNLYSESADSLFEKTEEIYRAGLVKQLPRAVEATHKFHVGLETDKKTTDWLLANKDLATKSLPMIPISPLSNSDILMRDLSDKDLIQLSNMIAESLDRYRIVLNPSGIYILFDKKTTHVTFLKETEIRQIKDFLKVTMQQ